MLTPAEELGLSGLSLAGRVRKALYRIPEPILLELDSSKFSAGFCGWFWALGLLLLLQSELAER